MYSVTIALCTRTHNATHNACFISRNAVKLHFAGVGTETQSTCALTGCRASKGRYPSTSLDEKARTNSYEIVAFGFKRTNFITEKNACVNAFYKTLSSRTRSARPEKRHRQRNGPRQPKAQIQRVRHIINRQARTRIRTIHRPIHQCVQRKQNRKPERSHQAAPTAAQCRTQRDKPGTNQHCKNQCPDADGLHVEPERRIHQTHVEQRRPQKCKHRAERQYKRSAKRYRCLLHLITPFGWIAVCIVGVCICATE